MTSSNDIRATFLDYFARHDHKVIDSSPLVPRNDPTLLFVNSGMVQFKNVFTGQERPPTPPRADHRPKMRARWGETQRSRQCRLHRPASHLLRDARQFQLWRLFQGPGDRARLEPGHARVRAAEGQTLRHRVRRRRRRGVAVASDRGAAGGADHPHRDLRQFLAHGRHRAVRTRAPRFSTITARKFRAVRRAAPTRTATGSSRSGTWCSCSTRRGRRASRTAAAAPLDRHRHGVRAHRRGAAGQTQQLRHRPVSRADSSPAPRSRDRIRTARSRPATASSPIICVARRS